MEQLINTMDLLKSKDSNQFYTNISCLTINNDEETKLFNNQLMPKMYSLYDNRILQKDLLYLTLLANENFDLLNRILQYDKTVFSLNIEDPVSLFDYCLCHNDHWFEQLIRNHDKFKKLKAAKAVYKKLMLLKFIDVTNRPADINLHEIERLLMQINTGHLPDEEFWKFYCREITRLIDTVAFCRDVGHAGDIDGIYKHASTNNLLDTLSAHVDLSEATLWDSLLDKLRQSGRQFEYETFASFTITCMILRLLSDDCSDIPLNDMVENIKLRTVLLKAPKFQIELLENMFALLFHRRNNDFACKEKDVRLLLFIVKAIVDELKANKAYAKQLTDEQLSKRFAALNSHVNDALWRLELVTAVKNTPKVEDQLMNYLLAPPESLVHLCLRRSDYERAYQVVEIFNLQQCDIAYEIGYAEKFLKFKDFLRERARTTATISIADFARKFFDGEKHVNLSHEKLIEANMAEKPFVTQYAAKNAKFIDLFDLAITNARSRQDYKEMLQVANDSLKEEHPTSYYYRFYKRLCEASKVLNLAPWEILISPRYNLDVSAHKKLEDFHANLAELYDRFDEQLANDDLGILNRNHATHKTLLQINELLSSNVDSVQYVKKLYNYLQAFAKVFYIEQNTSDLIAKYKNTSYFELLHYNRSELIGILLFEKHLDPGEFEKYFGKLKLDFLYAVVGNCFPTINLHAQENVSHDELYHDNFLYKPTKAIIEYIEKHNWLLAFILHEMYKVPDVQINISEVRLKTFFNFLQSRRIQNLKTLFGDNEMVAGIQNCINVQKVKTYFDEKIVEYDLMSINSGASDDEQGGANGGKFFETGQEILEDAKTTNWKHLWDIVESIPENQRRRKTELIRCGDSVLANLVQDGFEPEHYNYVHAIQNPRVRIETILNNFKKWPGESAMDVIRSEVTRFDSIDDESTGDILKDWLKKIEFSVKLEGVLGYKDWYKSFDYCKNNVDYALKALLQTNDIDMLLEFLDLFAPIDEEILHKIELNYVTKIVELNTPPPKVKALLDKLPFAHSINICNNLLTILRKLEYLQFIADYLNLNVTDDIFLKNVQVSLKMLAPFTAVEQDQLFCLISEPMSIVEVLLMNTKLDSLATVLDILKIDESDYDETIISSGKIDEMLRKYAAKSLDFRVIVKPHGRDLRNAILPGPRLLESVDSSKTFVMPETVPTKEEWVKNDEVWECMCCQQVAFSMFYRRHHCRRCGRMVCHTCSTKRMLVQTYGDILVRVCKDCYDQTVGTSCSSERSSDGTSSRSISHEYWLLNDDAGHNQIVREEFSYEHAPSVSLCLSILKYHSKSPEYSKFLLDCCEDMLKLLQPCADKNLTTIEIDYQLVIKMLKSLVSAAKVLSAEILHNSSSADRILNQVELLSLLSQQGCLNLMPVLDPNSSYLDRTVLRSLRDKLLKREQWHLALEVSTKGGLDNLGVWAAWGKSCLKAGCLSTAREKFQRCLDRGGGHDGSSSLSKFSSNDSLNTSISRPMAAPLSRLSTTSESARANKNPPALLFEIVNILERKTRKVHTYIDNEPKIRLSGSSLSLVNAAMAVSATDPAIEVLNRIKNLQLIVNGGSKSCEFMNIERVAPTTQPAIDRVFYDECVYYLSRYGTSLSLLEFYVRHGHHDAVVEFVLANNINTGVFVDVYMKCLKHGVVQHLQRAMSKVDSSLEIFKDYIKSVCFNLEKRRLLNSLYHLQLFMGDYVRASMTCIRFYEADVTNFTELKANVFHLHKAAEHLKQIKEVEWVDVSSVKTDVDSEAKFEEKILTPASSALVMKMDSKDLDKHIGTIYSQIELVDYLSECESSGINLLDMLRDLASAANETKVTKKMKLPTLFSNADDKALLATLVLVCRQSVEDGFKMAANIVTGHQLRPVRVYGLAGKYLAQTERYENIMQLVKNIKSLDISGRKSDAEISNVLDETLNFAVGVMIKRNVTGTVLVQLSKLIKDRAIKINALIEAKELNQALYLASKYKRINDVRRIQREAELLNFPFIKAACTKILAGSTAGEASTSNQ